MQAFSASNGAVFNCQHCFPARQLHTQLHTQLLLCQQPLWQSKWNHAVALALQPPAFK
jgi:hypothetical protein